jgi:hypothetical protein
MVKTQYYMGVDYFSTVTKRLVKYIDKLMDDFMKSYSKLCDKEIYILLSSCYLHDLGMHYQYLNKLDCYNKLKENHPEVNLDNILSKQGNWDLCDKKDLVRVIRDEHHQISCELINKRKICGYVKANIEGLDDKLYGSVAVVCLAHCFKEEDELKKIPEKATNDSEIRLQFICRIFRIVDLLDITHERADIKKMAWEYIDNDSKTHWYKHHYTRDLRIDSVNNPLIRPMFYLPCSENSDLKKYYEVIPEWTIRYLKKETNKHIDYFKAFKYLVNIDDRIDSTNVIYMEDLKRELSRGNMIDRVIPQIDIEPIKEENLLKLILDSFKYEE